MRENKIVSMYRRDSEGSERLSPVGRGVRLALAFLAIGQAFLLEGPVTLWQALAVVLGAFLAIEAIVGWGPVAAWHAAQREWLRERRERRRRGEEPVAQTSAEAAHEADRDLRRAA